ncbi:MAG: DsbA family protein [Candidatus Uhrbacteria bacterium]|nr:DsbA family protein [Candidatus Uhrbacteria bacterium]
MSILSNNSDSVAGLTGSPKTMFILGLAVGVGAMAILALICTMMLIVKGNLSIGGKAAAPSAPSAPLDPSDPQAQAPTQPAGPVPEVTGEDHVKGNANAKVTLIEYSDFECPYCAKHNPSIDQALKDFPNDVRVIYRHFPLSFHPNAQKAAVASECAAKQGKFWEMHDGLFKMAETEGLTIEGMRKLAGDLKLNTGDFNTCLDGDETLARVEADYNGGVAAGVSGTPGTFVNGKIVEGAVPYASFKQAIVAAGASK